MTPLTARMIILSAAATVAAAAGACDLAPGARINPEADRVAITLQIDAAIAATRDKDIDAYMAQIPDDILMHDADGNPLSRAAIREQVLAAWANVERTRYIGAVVDSLFVEGDSAAAFTTQTWDRLMTRPDTTTLSGIAIDTIVTMSQKREMWRRTAAGWRAFEVIDLGGTTSINGSVHVRPPG